MMKRLGKAALGVLGISLWIAALSATFIGLNSLIVQKGSGLPPREPHTVSVSKISIGGEDIPLYRVDVVEVDHVYYVVVFSGNGSVAITKK